MKKAHRAKGRRLQASKEISHFLGRCYRLALAHTSLPMTSDQEKI